MSANVCNIIMSYQPVLRRDLLLAIRLTHLCFMALDDSYKVIRLSQKERRRSALPHRPQFSFQEVAIIHELVQEGRAAVEVARCCRSLAKR